MKLIEFENDDSGILYLSDPLNIISLVGAVFFVRVENTAYFSREWEQQAGTYHVSLGCVCAASLSPDTLDSLLQSTGFSLATWDSGSPQAKAAELVHTGYKATLWQQSGNNLRKIMAEARRKLTQITENLDVFKYYMDLPQNQLGTTGWDWLDGNFVGKQPMSMSDMVKMASNNERQC